MVNVEKQKRRAEQARLARMESEVKFKTGYDEDGEPIYLPIRECPYRETSLEDAECPDYEDCVYRLGFASKPCHEYASLSDFYHAGFSAKMKVEARGVMKRRQSGSLSRKSQTTEID